MAKNSDDCLSDKTPSPKESESNKSFVKKVKSRVSGFLPSSISKWFGSTESQVRQREDSDSDDEEFFDIQPPSKRIKPSLADGRFASTSRANHVEKKIVGSIFPEPVAGPSGLQSRKTFTPTRCAKYRRMSGSQDVFNGDKYSDSGESTSGYSSMPKIGSKEQLAETSEAKTLQTPVNTSTTKYSLNTTSSINERSLFSEKSLSPQQANTSLSSRQPSFNSSVFGSPNFVDRTISSKRIMNSPFYNGRTIYGGASAYGRHLGQASFDTKLPLKNVVQIKPVNDKVLNDSAVLSKTARRILDTLEQYTTPIAEAKKIPNPSLRRPLKNVGASPYSIRGPRVPSNKELQVPTVPDLLKMKQKERLQDSTVSVRQIAASSKSSLNTEEYSIKATDESVPKHTNKIKAKVSNARQKPPVENEVVPEVKLPDIQLPISTLPKFDFSLSTPPSSKKPSKTESTFTSTTTTTLKTIKKTSPNKEETKITSTKEETLKTETSKVEKEEVVSRKTENSRTETSCSQKTLVTEYKFAEPLVLAENIESIKAINNFIFSEPLSKKQDKSVLEVPNNFKISSESKKPQPLKPDVNIETAPNVLTWECSVCLIRNIPGDKTCKACNALHRKSETKKSKVEQQTPNAVISKNNFGGEFKLSADKWECATCLVRNNVTDSKCVACTTPRASAPNTKAATTESGFGNKFKLPSNSWECPACMIRNKNELAKCMACESPRPAGIKPETKPAKFGGSFKRKEGEWECDSCMVRNSPDLNRCQCCEAVKPGKDPIPLYVPIKNTTLSTFNFGIDKNSLITARGFVPIVKPSENVAPIFPPVASVPTSTPVTFTFGIKPVQSQEAKPEDNGPKITAPEEVSMKPTGFVFGASAVTTSANNFVFKEPLPVVVTSSMITENVKEAPKSDKPVSLNGDINKSESVFKSVPSSMPQLNSSIQTNSAVSDAGKETASNLFAFGAKPQPQPQPQPQQQRQQELAQPMFGGSNNNNNDGQSTSLFKFMPAENKTVANDKPLFGSPFGGGSSNTSVFGQTSAVSFGAAPAPSAGAFGVQAKPFAFGAAAPNVNKQMDSSPKVPFAFGQNAVAKPETNMFSFGANTGAAPAPNIFGSPSNVNVVQPSAGVGFNFNSAPFGALPQPAQNGTFNFGNNVNSAPKAGFSFGAPIAAPAVQPTIAAPPLPMNPSGIFNFGAPSNMQPPTGSGGFNFGSSDVKPNFNFTGGAPPPTFSAGSGTEKPRVIRRAVRRTQR